MRRFFTEQLVAWKTGRRRKPLILRGMRQCGKTWALKEFGATHYKNVAYASFDETESFKSLFAGSKDPARIVTELSFALGAAIRPGETLIVLDEIQECPNAIGALKYFAENAPEHHVACAGSLLGIRIAGGGSFPVGKVDFLSVGPMTFSEFLVANGDENLYEYAQQLDSLAPLPAPLFDALADRLKLYFVTGGMPEAVLEWTQGRDPAALERLLANILISYNIDFSKHLDAAMFQKVAAVWASLPAQLARENKKFLYRAVKEGGGAREYGEAIQWLADADLITRVTRSKAPGLPISAYDDDSAFKLYAADVGLLRRLSGLAPSALAEGDRLFTEFKGAFAENYVLQSLSAQYDSPLRYWASYNPTYEVDFMVQHGNRVLPIEVKAGKDTKGKALAVYRDRYRGKVPLRLRFSLRNLSLVDDMLNIPFFLADQTRRLVDMALQ